LFRRLFFLSALLLAFASVQAMSLAEAERALSSGNKSKIFRAYDTYKSCYLQARISNDAAKRKRCLEGIVASGKKLHIDVHAYEEQLALIGGKTLRRGGQSAPKTKTSKRPKVLGQNALRDVRWENGRLVLKFDKKLGRRDVNFFRLKKTKKKGYRYVFDIHGVLKKRVTLTHRELRSVRLSQYKPSTIRLVLESDKALPVRFSRSGSRLTIDAGLAGVTSPKVKTKVTAVSPSRKAHRTKTIVLDPGHGGKDPGAIGHRKYREKDIVFSIAKKTAKILRERGYKVYMTRTKDRFVKLRHRTHFANKKRADLFVSIHANAVPKRNVGKAYGIETYFLSRSRSKRAADAAAMENKVEIEDMNYYAKSTFLNALNSEKIIASHKLAIDLQSGILSSLRARYSNVKDGGVREGPFWVLVGAQMPAVLVEVGFITHPTEGARLHSGKYQDYFARGLADGIEQYFLKNR